MSYPPKLLEDWANDYAAKDRWTRFAPVRVYGSGFSDDYDVHVDSGFVGLSASDSDGKPYEACYRFTRGALEPATDLPAWQASPGRPAPFLVTRPVMRRLGIVPACWIFALPGMGKSSLVARQRYPAPMYDADYGAWRRLEGIPSKWDQSAEEYHETLCRFMDHLRDMIPEPGPRYPWIPVFLCNELDLIPFALAMGHEVGMLLPAQEFQWTWIDGIVRRAEDRAAWAPYDCDVGECERAFAKKAVERHPCWIEEWRAAAVGWSIPVGFLDHYLSERDVGILRQGCRLSPALRELAARSASIQR